jgi:hypothetical protein
MTRLAWRLACGHLFGRFGHFGQLKIKNTSSAQETLLGRWCQKKYHYERFRSTVKRDIYYLLPQVISSPPIHSEIIIRKRWRTNTRTHPVQRETKRRVKRIKKVIKGITLALDDTDSQKQARDIENTFAKDDDFPTYMTNDDDYVQTRTRSDDEDGPAYMIDEHEETVYDGSKLKDERAMNRERAWEKKKKEDKGMKKSNRPKGDQD